MNVVVQYFAFLLPLFKESGGNGFLLLVYMYHMLQTCCSLHIKVLLVN